MYQCSANTKSGNQCERKHNNQTCCWQHKMDIPQVILKKFH